MPQLSSSLNLHKLTQINTYIQTRAITDSIKNKKITIKKLSNKTQKLKFLQNNMC